MISSYISNRFEWPSGEYRLDRTLPTAGYHGAAVLYQLLRRWPVLVVSTYGVLHYN